MIVYESGVWGRDTAFWEDAEYLNDQRPLKVVEVRDHGVQP